MSMRVRGAILVGMLGIPVVAARPQATADETGSAHRLGPHGMQGWTVKYPLPDEPDQHVAGSLVIRRKGYPDRRFQGDPLIFNWMFVADGQQIAYESGPLHFGLRCVLADIRTGRRLADVDCYHELPRHAPSWVRQLEGMQ